MRRAAKAATALATVVCFATTAFAADLGAPRHRHRGHRPPVIEEETAVVPPGYAYGGYGNGPGPGWSDAQYGPPGFGPGYGYIPPGSPDAGFDLGR